MDNRSPAERLGEKFSNDRANEELSIIYDALRYRKLRSIAMNGGNLEAVVAVNQLDFVKDDSAFDDEVDSIANEFTTSFQPG